MLQFAWRYLAFLYDMRGLLHFKSRFRPHWEERFVAVWPHVTIRGLAAFAIVSRVGIVHPGRALRLAVRDFRNRSRRTMVDAPDLEAAEQPASVR
jgi:hypothetical protein